MSRSRVQTSWLLISPPSWNWPLSTSSFFFSIIDLYPLQYSCLENPMDGGACWAAAHGVAKSQTWLSNFPFTFHFHALEKEMATRSSVLAWRIPGTGEPGGLPSIGSHRVRHDWSDLAVAMESISLLHPNPGLVMFIHPPGWCVNCSISRSNRWLSPLRHSCLGIWVLGVFEVSQLKIEYLAFLHLSSFSSSISSMFSLQLTLPF